MGGGRMGFLLWDAIGSDPFEKSKSKEKVEEVRRVPTNNHGLGWQCLLTAPITAWAGH